MSGFEDEEQELMARIAGEWSPPHDAQRSSPFPIWAEKMVGTTLGERHRYTIERVLGVGGMGVVFAGRGDDGVVAIKILAPSRAGRSEARHVRFGREIDVLARIDSPYVVRVLDWGRSPCDFLVMEYLEGEDLGARLTRSPRLDWPSARDLAIRVCKGLAAAHAQGIAHRDLKPSNCFLCSDGSLKLLDFGLAAMTGQEKLTRTDEPLGTVAYMPPERFGSPPPRRDEEGRVDLADGRVPRAQLGDLYALGVMLYEMVTGALPYDAPDALSLALLLTSRTPPRPPSALGVALPPSAEALILRLLEKEPRQRFQTADEVLTVLEGVALPIPRAAPRWRGVAALTAFVATAGLGATWWARPSPHSLSPLVFARVDPPAAPAVGMLPTDWAEPWILTPVEVDPEPTPPVEPQVSRARARPSTRDRGSSAGASDVALGESPAPTGVPGSPPGSGPSGDVTQPRELLSVHEQPPPEPPPEKSDDIRWASSLDERVFAQAERCRRGARGLRVVVTFNVDASGRVSWVRSHFPHAHSPAGNCVANALQGVNFGEAFRGTHLHELKL